MVEADIKTKEGLLEIIKARRAKWAGMPIAGALVGESARAGTLF